MRPIVAKGLSVLTALASDDNIGYLIRNPWPGAHEGPWNYNINVTFDRVAPVKWQITTNALARKRHRWFVGNPWIANSAHVRNAVTKRRNTRFTRNCNPTLPAVSRALLIPRTGNPRHVESA